MGADQYGSEPPEEDCLGDSGHTGLLHAVTQQFESIGAESVGSKIIRLVEINVVDLSAGDEGLDRQRPVTVGNGRGEFVRLGDYVLPFSTSYPLTWSSRSTGLPVSPSTNSRRTRLPVERFRVLKAMRSEDDAAV
jgi:hypothetical protein